MRPPIPVGHRERPNAELPAPEAYFSGGIGWYNRFGFAHDWLTHWTNQNDTIWWEVDVVTPGPYAVDIQYACPPQGVGTRLRVEAGGASLVGEIARAHAPEPRLCATRTSKRNYIQTFATQDLGEIRLAKGRSRVIIRGIMRPGDAFCDLKSLRLRLVE